MVQYPRKFNDGYWLFCLTHSEIGIYPLVIKWGYDEREIWWKEFGIESGIYPTIKNPDYLQKAYKALKDLNLLNAWACEWFHKCGYVSEEQLNLF